MTAMKAPRMAAFPPYDGTVLIMLSLTIHKMVSYAI